MAGKNKNKSKRHRLLLKWGRLVLAIVSSIILLNKPVFNFIDEKGIVSVKTYKITTRTFEMHYVDMKTGLDELVGAMSISGLFYGALAIMVGCFLCALLYESHRIRILLSSITAFMAGAYYLLMAYYAMKISDLHYATLYPTVMAILPAIVLQMMVLVQRNVRHIGMYRDEEE